MSRTPEQVAAVLAEVQKGADAFVGLEIVKAANFFTDAQKSSLTKPTEASAAVASA